MRPVRSAMIGRLVAVRSVELLCQMRHRSSPMGLLIRPILEDMSAAGPWVAYSTGGRIRDKKPAVLRQ
jgi:hypothetical protein